MGETKRPAEVPSLTGLRWLAATLVFLYHTRQSLRADPGGFLRPLYEVGWAGVTIFFVLSGFLLSMIYFEPFRDGVRPGAFKAYVLKRVARIYPLYYALLLLALLAHKGRPFDALDLLAHLVMLHGFFGDFATSFVPPAWSLTIEESFYLLLPPVLLFLGRVGRRRDGGVSPARLVAGLVAVNAACLACGHLLTTSGAARPRGFLNDWVNQTILGQMPTFSLGILAGLLWHARPGCAVFASRVWANLTGLAALGLFAAGARYFAGRPSWMGDFTGQAFFAGAAALFLLSLCGRSVFAAALGARPFVYGGRVSYAFYLIHLHPAFQDLVGAAQHKDARLGEPLLVYLFYQGCSAVLYEVIEKPFHRGLRRRWALKG